MVTLAGVPARKDPYGKSMLRERIRVRFAKKGDLRFISHLDLMRAFERALRRAMLPLKMTDGFNPHPRLSFPLALGVGSEGSDEVMEFQLADWVPVAEIGTRLSAVLPSGLELRSAELAAPGKPARACETTYIARPRDAHDPCARVEETQLRELLGRKQILVFRRRKGRTKDVDIRPFVLDLRREGCAAVMRFRVTPAGTTRPEEILGALGHSPEQCHALFHIERTQVVLASPSDKHPNAAGP